MNWLILIVAGLFEVVWAVALKQWRLVDMVADEKTVAVQWECSGTFNGEAPFAGLQPNGRRFTTTVMNFYSFDANGKICKDVAATGIAGILQGIGALP
jgi:predicted ester cyclase